MYAYFMSMYPPDKENEQFVECNVCGAPEEMQHHPNCPVAAGEEIFIMDADIVNIMTNAITKSAMEYMKKIKTDKDKLLATSRFEQMQEDYLEIGRFGQALFDTGKLSEAKDVLHFIQNTSMYEPFYLLWIELNRPQKVGARKETWDMFHNAVWNLKSKRKEADGQQTEDTGN